MKKKRDELAESVILIKSKTHGEFKFIVDTEDYERLNKYKWSVRHYRGSTYASRSGKRNVVKREHYLLHREILGVKNKWEFIDHINGDTLDNRKQNLRVCDLQRNTWNSKKTSGTNSVFKGVSVIFLKIGHKYKASIRNNGKTERIGEYKTEIEAAIAYDVRALELFGEFANINFKKEFFKKHPHVMANLKKELPK